MEVSATAESQQKTLQMILQQQRTMEKKLAKIDMILQRQKEMEEKLGMMDKILDHGQQMEKQMQMLLETVLSISVTPTEAVARGPSGADTVTPPESPTSAPREGTTTASLTHKPAVPPRNRQSSGGTSQGIATPTRRQRSTVDKAPRRLADISRSPTQAVVLRSERTCDKQDTSDISLHDADSEATGQHGL